MIHFASEPVKIGKHEWRVIVRPCNANHADILVTEYQWREALHPQLPATWVDSWKSEVYWPTYNADDGTHAGCPKSIAKKVWEPNKKKIEELLKGGKP
jgi:hypothetical protein